MQWTKITKGQLPEKDSIKEASNAIFRTTGNALLFY
jgi:hypothetical protein